MSEMWIFGYGSLIWKVDFPYVERVPGYIRGYVRRFWQASHDHRGVPGDPGRVVTLIPHAEFIQMQDEYQTTDQESTTWGVAYRIDPSHVEFVQSHLDYREKDGYSLIKVDMYNDGSADPVLRNVNCYVGHTDNESFHGYKPIKELAFQIVKAKGPSGPNAEYLLNLAKAMRQLAPNAKDEHLYTLETLVLEILAQSQKDLTLL